MKKSFLRALLAFFCVTVAHAADAPTSDDKSNTVVYRAEIPQVTWDGWDDQIKPRDPTAPKPEPEQFEKVPGDGQTPRTFSGKVVLDGSMEGIQVCLISLVGCYWNNPGCYQWEPVAADGSFNITDKNYLTAYKTLAMRGPNNAWTFLRYDFGHKQGGRNIVLKAVPSKKVTLTASGSDGVDLTRMRYEAFNPHTEYDDGGDDLFRQRSDDLEAGDKKSVEVVLPVGEIAIFAHHPGYADFYQIVDTTKADNIHFVLMPGGQLKITVLDSSGKPMAGVPVNWINRAAPLSIVGQQTNANGIVTADHLAPGTFDLDVKGFAKRKIDITSGEESDLVLQEGKTQEGSRCVFSPW